MFSQEVPHPSVRQKAEPRLPNAAANAKTLKIARPKTSIQYREFSRETGRNFYPRLSFKQILISKEHPSLLKLKLTIAKRCHVLFEKIFFEFRIMIYRTMLNSSAMTSRRVVDYARARRKRTNIYTFATATRKTVTNYRAQWPRD